MFKVIVIPDLSRARDRAWRWVLPGLAAVAAIGALPAANGTGTVNCTVSAGPGQEPVTCSARLVDLDYKNNRMHLKGDVRISQGDISVAADAAEATMAAASKNSHWVFTDNVHIRAEKQGDLRADRATVEITNGALASADVNGSPAQFEQTRATSGRLVKGHAAAIHYDVAAATVKLTGDALLSDVRNAGNDIDGPTITYNIREQRIVGDSSGVAGGRVDMTITPKSAPGKSTHDGSAPPGKP
jgi:lipopolysaccharide transport protein LptA